MAHAHAVLKVKVIKAVNLAVRDKHHNSSDPYVVVMLGDQKVKTHAIKRNLNPEWNHEFTLTVENPKTPIKIEVLDHDPLKKDDLLGHAVLDIYHLVEGALRHPYCFLDSHLYMKVPPTQPNGLASESYITRVDQHGKFVQTFHLILKDVESGELFVEVSCLFTK